MATRRSKRNVNKEQGTLWMGRDDTVESVAAAPALKKPVTDVMKTVASKSLNPKILPKSFTKKEIAEILRRKADGDAVSKNENRKLRDEYRRIKRIAKEMEANNNRQIILVPSLVGESGFYKLFELSALYYAYRLAPRMGRSARIVKDNDHFTKMQYVVSLLDIEKFIDQMEQLEDATYEITTDGIYVFTLKKALTVEEVTQLKLVEEQRKDRFHNVMKPKNVDPATYNQIMIAIRQIAPKARKLEKHYYYAVGESMIICL